jgi:hypothetical protein
LVEAKKGEIRAKTIKEGESIVLGERKMAVRLAHSGLYVVAWLIVIWHEFA